MEDRTTTTLVYDFRNTRLGTLLVAASPRGVCFVRFGSGRAELEDALRREFPCATPSRSARALALHCDASAAYVDGATTRLEVPLDVRGSWFQRRVWRELAAIPRGQTRSYSELARSLGNPRGARAVARACAANPTPVVVPCHRVVQRNGGLGGYAYGRQRKLQLLASEGVRLASGERPPDFLRRRRQAGTAPRRRRRRTRRRP